jgi:hypothetical protein
MSVIWKTRLSLGTTTVAMPKGSQVLSVGNQREEICLWFKVPRANGDGLIDARIFEVHGTGHPIEDGPGELEYIGTVQFASDNTVFHVFERVSVAP